MELTWTVAAILLLIGVAVGTISGMIGLGGGIMVIPILMFFFGFSQAKANGTSLAMLLPPIGIFAVIAYSKAGNISWGYAGLLALGFAGGAYIGGLIVNSGVIHPGALRVIFALFLIYVAGTLLFRTDGTVRAASETTILVVVFALTYLVMRMLGRRYLKRSSWGDVYRDRLRRGVLYDYEI